MWIPASSWSKVLLSRKQSRLADWLALAACRVGTACHMHLDWIRRANGPHVGQAYEPEFWVCEYDLASPGRMWHCGTSKGACVALHFIKPAVARSLPGFSIWWGEWS